MGRRASWNWLRLKTTSGLRLYEVPLILRGGLPKDEYTMHPLRTEWLVLARSTRQARRVAQAYWHEGMVYEVAKGRIRQKQLPAAGRLGGRG